MFDKITESWNNLSPTAKNAAKVGAVAAAVPVVGAVGLQAVGFKNAGVAAGAAAAGIQAGIGNVPAGGAFALCQHLGARMAVGGVAAAAAKAGDFGAVAGAAYENGMVGDAARAGAEGAKAAGKAAAGGAGFLKFW